MLNSMLGKNTPNPPTENCTDVFNVPHLIASSINIGQYPNSKIHYQRAVWEIHFGFLINRMVLLHFFHNVALKDCEDNQHEDKVKNELEIFD